jgi:hypothetical protein
MEAQAPKVAMVAYKSYYVKIGRRLGKKKVGKIII